MSEGWTTRGSSAPEYLASSQTAPDAAIVVLNDRHSNLPDDISPYLIAKATLMMSGVPTQEIRVSKLSSSPYELQYILQNFSIALYAKMNGTPWTANQDTTISDELIIGLGTSESSASRFDKKTRYVGVTTVFRGDGNYLLGHVSKECSYDEYPQMLKYTTERVLQDLKQRNGWAFLTVTVDHPFLVLDPSQKGIATKTSTKGVLVPDRGIILQIGRYTRLVCTNGPQLMKHDQAPLPAPLLVHLHKGSTFQDLTYLSEQVLKFTGFELEKYATGEATG
jgi:hypothetical protein